MSEMKAMPLANGGHTRVDRNMSEGGHSSYVILNPDGTVWCSTPLTKAQAHAYVQLITAQMLEIDAEQNSEK